MENPDRWATPTESEQTEQPSAEQLRQYRDLMISILHRMGRGVRHGRIDERAPTRIGTEYFLPGAHTECSEPNRDGIPHIERDNTYSASFRRIGTQAGKLIVLETRSELSEDKTTYSTARNIFRFRWDELGAIIEAEVMPIETYSSAETDAEIMEANAAGEQRTLLFDHEETVADSHDGEHFSFVSPLRETESPWMTVSADDVSKLHERTAVYGEDRVAQSAR